jgi:hypothetical protein
VIIVPDPDGFGNVEDEDLAIADFACSRRADDGLDDFIGPV